MDPSDRETKHIQINGTKNRYNVKQTNRIPTETGLRTESMFWGLSDSDMIHSRQMYVLFDDVSNMSGVDSMEHDSLISVSPLKTLMVSQIKKKLAGYKKQDILHGTYDPHNMVLFEDVIKLLRDSKLVCVYCSKCIYIAYRNVRYDYQWSLDRIDNAIGHVRDNVAVSCLKCNLSRRNITHHAFKNTKQLTISKVA